MSLDLLTWVLPGLAGLATGFWLRPMRAGWVFDALILLVCALLLRAVLVESEAPGTTFLNPYALTLGFAAGHVLRALLLRRRPATEPLP